MIVLSEIEKITAWVNENRPDKESEKPYFMANEVEGVFEMQEDPLIEKGLKELGIDYKIVSEIKGISVELESKYFN